MGRFEKDFKKFKLEVLDDFDFRYTSINKIGTSSYASGWHDNNKSRQKIKEAKIDSNQQLKDKIADLCDDLNTYSKMNAVEINRFERKFRQLSSI